MGSPLDAVLREADALDASVGTLAQRWDVLCREAAADLQANPPEPPWLPEGCEDAPPEVMGQIVEMVAGCGFHPPHPVVDTFWISLSREALARQGTGRHPAWSTVALREAARSVPGGSPTVAALQLRAQASPVALRAAEVLDRWHALETALVAGLGNLVPSEIQSRVEVYATHLTNDDYVLGAEALAASLAATGTTRPLLALVTDGLSQEGRAALGRAGWKLVDVVPSGVEGEDTFQARGFFSKIWLWALPVHAVIYIDTDILLTRNIDGLFSSCQGSAMAAAPDSQPHMDGELISQTGLLVVEPAPALFRDLWAITSGERRPRKLDEWKQFEQGFFTIFFDNGEELKDIGGGCGLGWKVLGGEYNFCVRYHARPLYKGLNPVSSNTVHFACAKPWDPLQRSYAPPAYQRLFLEFARAAGIRWRSVECAADKAREEANKAKIQKIMVEREARGEK